MAVVAKPAVTTDVFADTAVGSPDIAIPTYMNTGFPLVSGVPVIPPRGFFNWLFNYCMKGVRYLMQRGITDWDAAEDGYAAGALVASTDGNQYRLLGTATTGMSPQSDQGNWVPFPPAKQLNDALGGGATSFDGPANPTAWDDLLTGSGAAISGLDVVPTFISAAAFGFTVGPGSGFLNTNVGLHAGESVYRSIHWSSVGLASATPDAGHDRIDAVTVTPSAFGSDSALAVVTGTPASNPLAPAIPSGSGALFYVLVPAAAPDSTTFRACRGLWRRVGYPWSGMSGIISGAELSWDYTADPAAASADLYFGAPDLTSTNVTVHRILIDGEPIEWVGSETGQIVNDSTANPFGSSASSSFDRPYYIYAVGGRHNPMPREGVGCLNPVTIVESTVVPNPRTGKPTANMTVNGITVTPNGAVYLGLGFVVQGTTRRRGCLMDGEMTVALNPLQLLNHTFATTGAEDIGTFTGGAQPVISTKMLLNIQCQAPSANAAEFFLRLENFPPAGSPSNDVAGVVVPDVPANGVANLTGISIPFTARTGAELWAFAQSATTSGSVMIVGAMGFNHRVNRICVGY